MGVAMVMTEAIDCCSVKPNRRFAQLTLALMAALLLGAGCGGMGYTRTVSPIDFFVPRLLKAEPPAQTPDDVVPPLQRMEKVASTGN